MATSDITTAFKRAAATRALDFVQPGMKLGLGTGSTADLFLELLAHRVRDGMKIIGAPTSDRTAQRSRMLGIPVADLDDLKPLDLVVDGADEADSNLALIKGGGGALLREKIVAQNSSKLVIIADSGKFVSKLGTHSLLPIEVVQFAHESQEKFLRSLGTIPTLRRATDGAPFVTDNGNFIYDCRFANGIDDAHELERTLKRRAGIVETGLFLGIAAVAIIADENTVEIRTR